MVRKPDFSSHTGPDALMDYINRRQRGKRRHATGKAFVIFYIATVLLEA